MIDLLLIHCESGISPLDMEYFLPPIGLVGLSSFLNANGLRSRIIDCRSPKFSMRQLANFLAEEKPRWIGIDVLSDTVFTAMRLVRIVRALSPDSRVVLGGPHATLASEALMREAMPDALVIGEGEIACLDLLKKRRLSEVRGIMRMSRNRIVRNEMPKPIDLDELPSPDYSTVLDSEVIPYAPALATARGCPYRCTFCAAPLLSSKIRWRSPGKIAADIDAIFSSKERKLPFLTIADDTFTFDLARTAAVCDAIKQVGGGSKFIWYAEARIDRIAHDPSVLTVMKAAGLRFLQLGIESGDERVLAAYRKGITLDQARRVCSACADLELLYHAGFIVGGPFESPATLNSTRNLMSRLAKDSKGFLQLNFTFMTPLPGTEIFMHPDRYGIEMLDPELYTSVSFDNCVTRTAEMSRAQIFRARFDMFTESFEMMRTALASGGERTKRAIDAIRANVGHFHKSMILLEEGLMERMKKIQTEILRQKAEKFAEYRLEAGDGWRHLMPTRLPSFGMSEDGTYAFEGILMDAEESSIFHYSTGKLSGSDIASHLGFDDERMKAALGRLEQRKAIVYRTF